MRMGKKILAVLWVVVLVCMAGMAGCLQENTEEDSSTTPTEPTTPTVTAEVCNDGNDNDGDGQIDCSDSDCSNSVSCASPTTDDDEGTADFQFEVVTATYDAGKYYLQGSIRNIGDAQGKVVVKYNARVGDLAITETKEAKVEIPTLEPGLRTTFSADVADNKYPMVMWTYWWVSGSTTSSEYYIVYQH